MTGPPASTWTCSPGGTKPTQSPSSASIRPMFGEHSPQTTTPESLQATYPPSVTQTSPVISQTSMLHNMVGMPQTTVINGSAQGNPQDVRVAQRPVLEGEQQQQQEQRLKMLMKLQQSLLMQKAASQVSQHHEYDHTKQIPHASLPRMNTSAEQSVVAADVRRLPEPQGTRTLVPTAQQSFTNAPQSGYDFEAAQETSLSSAHNGSTSDAFNQGNAGPMLQGAMSPQQHYYGDILTENWLRLLGLNANCSYPIHAAIIPSQKLQQQEVDLISQQMKSPIALPRPQQLLQKRQKELLHLQKQAQMEVTHLPFKSVDELKAGQEQEDSTPIRCGSNYHHQQGMIIQQMIRQFAWQQKLPRQVPNQGQLQVTHLHSKNVDEPKAGHQYSTLFAPRKLISTVIETPSSGASELPLLAEFKSADGTQGKVQSRVPTKTGERSPDHLLEKFIYFTVKLLIASTIVALLLIAYNEVSQRCRG